MEECGFYSEYTLANERNSLRNATLAKRQLTYYVRTHFILPSFFIIVY